MESQRRKVSEASVIRVVALTHQYGERVALRDVSFTADAGQIFSLLGPNGGGKSTLFRILTTMQTPSSGVAEIFGFDVTSQPAEVRKHIGVVFQSQSLDAKLTVRENLRHQGHLYGLRGLVLQNRMREMLSRMNLAGRENDFVETLSGGMRRRVELAKALLHRPKLLLLDEPSTGLDPGARRDFWGYLESLRDNEGVTIVLTTHFMEEGEASDRVGILDQGRLLALDAPAGLKSQIGGDVITAQSKTAKQLCDLVRERFGGDPQLLGDVVRIERQRGHEFITALVEAFPGQIESITVAKPTLEDVFIQRTGHQFWEEGGAAA